MALHEIIYLSRACESMTPQALTALMEKSRIDNEARGITGVLIYHQQEFLQLIEGEREAVESLYQSICNDPRHRQTYTMWSNPITERSFARWAMGFVAPREADLRGKPGYEPLLSLGLKASAHDTAGKKLLLMLRDDFLQRPPGS
jgi:hypothetical protein